MINQKPGVYSANTLPSGEVMDMEVEARKQRHLSEEQEREAVSVRIGYGEVDDDGNIKFSWKRLLVFAGLLP